MTNGFNRPAYAVLGASAFFYVTAEMIPVGLLPQISSGLSVSEADVGLLLTSYAVVAGLSTIPFTALSMRVPRHVLIAVTVAIFAGSQLAAALAPNFLFLTGARLICALAHGVFWAVLAPVVARLAPPGQAGRATSLVFLGNSLAIVLGVPLGTAIGQWLGWRVAIAILAAGGLVCVVALLKVLPSLPPLPRDVGTPVGARLRGSVSIIRFAPVAQLCAITTVLVVGHFTAYTYLAPLVRRTGGIEGAGLSLLLLAFGVAGVVTNLLIGRVVDRRPGPALAGLLGAMTLAVAVLIPVLGPVPSVLAALVWGGAFTAIPVCLSAAVLRVAPHARDAASAVHVVSFQIGIGAGAFTGERLVRAGELGLLPVIAAVLALASCVAVLAARRVFPARLDRADHERAEALVTAG